MGNQFYYLNAQNQVTGPCTTLQLMTLQKSGQLTDSSLVCAQGSEQWVELWSIFPAARLKGAGHSQAAAEPAAEAAPEATEAPQAAANSAPRPPKPIIPATSAQAAVIILLLAVILIVPYLAPLRPNHTWEYRKVVFPSSGNERIGPGALKYSTIQLEEELLNELGREGWEMVGSYMETETAFPNLGDISSARELLPNVRPQSLTVLFKRPAK